MSKIIDSQSSDKLSRNVDSIETGWRSRLLLTRGHDPRPLPVLANSITAFTYAQEWSGVLAYDEFADAITIRSAVPWDSTRSLPCRWTDDDDVRAAEWLQRQGIIVGPRVAREAADTVARKNGYHPLREYLHSLIWDGVPRLDYRLTSYFGVEPTQYSQTVGAKFLIGAVARVMKPGCKVDTCLILQGAQGTLKSTGLRVLFDPWFTDALPDIRQKDAAIQLSGVWLVELSELDAILAVNTSQVKAFLSRSMDRYRPPYGRRAVDVPRQCVFAGTVNHDTFLSDETGARRFWPVRTGIIARDKSPFDRDKLWAEATCRYSVGEPWWLHSHDLVALAEAEQQDRYDADVWQEQITTYLVERNDVSIDEVLTDCIGKSLPQCDLKDQKRVARCLRALGFERYRQRNGDELSWRYRRARN
jgi:predicted P-loop ATPase